MPRRRLLRVQSTKFDGSLHNDYEGELLDGLDDPEGPLRLLVFWPGRDVWWNVFHNHEPAGRRGFVSYANVSTPAELDGETVRWVDLDLDVVVMPDRVELDDEYEFEAHRVRYAYPPEIEQRARAAASELLALAARLDPPFDRASHVPGPG
jgi:protein associated with RNAse G/E